MDTYRFFDEAMQRYTISTPLVAIRLCSSSEADKAGVMSSLPCEAVVEIHGPSGLGTGMVEVSWERQRYAVFELDLATRATLEPTQLPVGEFSPSIKKSCEL